jgi:hypothetical protein
VKVARQLSAPAAFAHGVFVLRAMAGKLAE